MFSHGANVRADSLRQLDEIQKLGKILLFRTDACLYILRLEQIAQVEEEVVQASVGDRPGIKSQSRIRIDLIRFANLSRSQESIENGHDLGQKVASQYYLLRD